MDPKERKMSMVLILASVLFMAVLIGMAVSGILHEIVKGLEESGL